MPTVFDNLSANGFFHDVIEKEVESMFFPWLTSEVEKNLDRARVTRKIIDGILFLIEEPVYVTNTDNAEIVRSTI